MRVRKLSPTGDFTFGQSQLNFLVNSPQAVAQIVQTQLLLWLGEWYLDTTLGMPWIQGVLGKHNQATADATVQGYILNNEWVTDISQYASIDDQTNRSYIATALLDTTYGPTPVQIANETLY